MTSEGQYWWSDKKCKLPLEISFDVKCDQMNGEVLPMFSAKRKEWSGIYSSPIALSWYLSPNRADFTFRSNIFGGFPSVQRHAAEIIMEVGKFYHLTCQIFSDHAEYSVDGVRYASCKLKSTDVPIEGYFGMGNSEMINLFL